VKILALCAKGVQNGGKKGGVFCSRYNEVVFLCNGTDHHEIRKNVNRCALLNLNRRIRKILVSLKGVILSQNRHFWVVLMGLHMTGLFRELHFST